MKNDPTLRASGSMPSATIPFDRRMASTAARTSPSAGDATRCAAEPPLHVRIRQRRRAARQPEPDAADRRTAPRPLPLNRLCRYENPQSAASRLDQLAGVAIEGLHGCRRSTPPPARRRRRSGSACRPRCRECPTDTRRPPSPSATSRRHDARPTALRRRRPRSARRRAARAREPPIATLQHQAVEPVVRHHHVAAAAEHPQRHAALAAPLVAGPDIRRRRSRSRTTAPGPPTPSVVSPASGTPSRGANAVIGTSDSSQRGQRRGPRADFERAPRRRAPAARRAAGRP